jgi:hypothetical protein
MFILLFTLLLISKYADLENFFKILLKSMNRFSLARQVPEIILIFPEFKTIFDVL